MSLKDGEEEFSSCSRVLQPSTYTTVALKSGGRRWRINSLGKFLKWKNNAKAAMVDVKYKGVNAHILNISDVLAFVVR